MLKREVVRACLAVVLLLPAAGLAGAVVEQRDYVVQSGATCDGYPRAEIETPSGICAGLVVVPPPGVTFGRRQIRMPRTLLQLSETEWLVSDLGGWVPGQGAVWRVSLKQGQPAELTRLIGGLDMPHTLAKGPDGRVYVGQMGRIIAFDPNAAASAQVILAGLPDNRLHENRHPLPSFLFDRDGSMLVNVGAPSDQCAPAPPQGRCAETEGPDPAAVVRRYAYLGNGRWNPTPSIFARGLRNSLALAVSPSGAVVQAENSIDLQSAGRPYDEINRLVAGRHYGWPYCLDWETPAPAWAATKAMDCAGPDHAKPALLLPPHSAPLALAYYRGAMFPQLRGKLLVSFHGYRSVGARLVAFAVDSDGLPVAGKAPRYPTTAADGRVVRKPFPARVARHAAEPLVLTPGWNMVPGSRPRGWPVGVTVAGDGSIWIADDHNGAIIRLAADVRALIR